MDKILNDREVKDGIIVPIKLQYKDNGDPTLATDDYIDISYKSLDTRARILSNLYPYKFEFYGQIANSVEAVIQSLKYEDESVRVSCYDYSGIDAWHLRGMDPYEWEKTIFYILQMAP